MANPRPSFLTEWPVRPPLALTGPNARPQAAQCDRGTRSTNSARHDGEELDPSSVQYSRPSVIFPSVTVQNEATRWTPVDSCGTSTSETPEHTDLIGAGR